MPNGPYLDNGLTLGRTIRDFAELSSRIELVGWRVERAVKWDAWKEPQVEVDLETARPGLRHPPPPPLSYPILSHPTLLYPVPQGVWLLRQRLS